MEGNGEMFYEGSGSLLFQGTFKKGLFHNGVMFKDDANSKEDNDENKSRVLAVFRNGQILDEKKMEKNSRPVAGQDLSDEGDGPHNFIKPQKQKV